MWSGEPRIFGARFVMGTVSNEVGFGWTNGVFKVLLDELPLVDRRRALEGR